MEKTFNGTYPIILDGVTRGNLEVRQEGIWTIFEGKIEKTDGIIRLSVYGESEGYLGVMTPRDRYLIITKRMSALQLKAFPETITHAGSAGGAVSNGAVYLHTNDLSKPLPDDDDAPELRSEDNVSGIFPEAFSKDKIPEESLSYDGLDYNVKLPSPEDIIEDEEPYIPVLELVEPAASEKDLTVADNKTPSGFSEYEPPSGNEFVLEESSPAAKNDEDIPVNIDDIDSEFDDVTLWEPSANPWSLFTSRELRSAFFGVRGALVSRQEDKTLLAIPVDRIKASFGLSGLDSLEEREIEGTKYIIFQVINGKIS